MAEDTSVPTLSNRLRLLVLPQRLQHTLRKRYHTRASEKSPGNLKGFVDLPIDIALEIASYLSPYDLLQLSRLSKQFKSIFASRSARFIWRAVFCNSNRKCPADLNELQSASLFYDNCCMACGRIVRCKVFHRLYLRLCQSCQSVNLISSHDLRNRHPNALDLISGLPTSQGQCFKPEAELLLEKFFSLKTENSYQFITNRSKQFYGL